MPNTHCERSVLITGAARRLGRAIALFLARQGASIAVHYRASDAAAASTVDELRGLGAQAACVQGDLADPNAAKKVIRDAADAIGPLNVLINSASVFSDQPLHELTTDHWEQQFRVNVQAPVFLSKHFSAQRNSGTDDAVIINLLDWRAMRPPDTHLAYTASKAALVSVTKTLAQQLAPSIRVCGIAPGAVLPPDDRPDWHQQRAAQDIPLGRPGSPEDVTLAIDYLLRAGFVTGEILHVTGGEQL